MEYEVVTCEVKFYVHVAKAKVHLALSDDNLFGTKYGPFFNEQFAIDYLKSIGYENTDEVQVSDDDFYVKTKITRVLEEIKK